VDAAVDAAVVADKDIDDDGGFPFGLFPAESDAPADDMMAINWLYNPSCRSEVEITEPITMNYERR
jgi:hypothetical protein